MVALVCWSFHSGNGGCFVRLLDVSLSMTTNRNVTTDISPIARAVFSGVFGFYAPQLKDVMGYSELQTEVFHTFREIGNAFIIFQLFEETLVGWWTNNTTSV